MKMTCVGLLVLFECFGGDPKAPDNDSFCIFAKPIYSEFQQIPKDEARAYAAKRGRAILKVVADYKAQCIKGPSGKKQ